MNVIAQFFLLLPRSVALKLGIFIGIISFYLFKKRRVLALNNFNHALGKKTILQQNKKKSLKKLLLI